MHRGVLRPLARGRRRPAGHTTRRLTRPFRALQPTANRRHVAREDSRRARDVPRNRRPATLLSFPALQRFRIRGSARSRGLPPPPRSDLGVSHALAGLLPPEPLGSVSTRNAHGLRPSGYFSSRRADASFEASFLSCRSPQPVATLRQPVLRLGFRVFLPGSPCLEAEVLPSDPGRDPPGLLSPLRRSLSPAQDRLPDLSSRALRSGAPRGASAGASEFSQPASPAFPSREDAGPFGVLITSSWRPGLAVQRACR